MSYQQSAQYHLPVPLDRLEFLRNRIAENWRRLAEGVDSRTARRFLRQIYEDERELRGLLEGGPGSAPDKKQD